MQIIKQTLLSVAVLAACVACAPANKLDTATSAVTLTAADANEFLEQYASEMEKIETPAAHASWAYATYINFDTGKVNAYFNEQTSVLSARYAVAAAKFNDIEVGADTRRQLELLKASLEIAPPADPAKAERLAAIGSQMTSIYGAGEYCREDGTCLSLVQMSAEMATSRDPELLQEYWQGWREISKPMKDVYAEQVLIANEGAKELGFVNTSELWRAKYDMPAAEFPKELDRLWGQVKPFYEALQCHVRAELSEHLVKRLCR